MRDVSIKTILLLMFLMALTLCSCGKRMPETTEYSGFEKKAVTQNPTEEPEESEVQGKIEEPSKEPEASTDQEEQDITSEPETAPEDISNDTEQADDDWKELMKEAIDKKIGEYWENNQDDMFTEESQYRDNSSFVMLFIDNDDIPEIYIMPASSIMDGISLLYYKDGAVEEYDIDWSDSLEYIPRSGRICLYHGQHNPACESILTFPEQEILGNGAYAEPGWFDDTDHSVDGAELEYMWNDEFVSEKAYNDLKNELFNGDIHRAYEEEGFTYDDIRGLITG